MRGKAKILAWILWGVALPLLVIPSPAVADHSGYETSCYVCHTLNPAQGEPGTSYIYSQAKTLPQMKTALGLTGTAKWDSLPTPRNFGCTFCHSSLSIHGSPMAAVLRDFDDLQTYKHPVGINYLTRVNNDNEFLSRGYSKPGYVVRTDNTQTYTVPGNLECISCHDPNLLTYPDHDPNWVANKGTNPYALRSFSGANDNVRWNGFCANLCHNYTAAGASANTILASGRASHGITAGDISPGKGNCRDCHDGHKADQNDLIPSSVATTSDCANCHSKSNYSGTGSQILGPNGITRYYNGGHGKPLNEKSQTVALGCTTCHRPTTSDPATRHALPAPGSAATMNPVKNVKMLYPNDNSYGPCYPCHTTEHSHHYQAYSNVGIPTGACLTCHEPHGGDNVSGTALNRKMIRQKINVPAGGASTQYPYAYGTNAGGNSQTVDFRADNGATASYNPTGDNTGNSAGVCVVCHDNAPPGTSAYKYIANHGGGNMAGTDCFSCHTKGGGNSPTGAGGFPGPQCNGCHNAPPLDISTGMVHQVHDRLTTSSNLPSAYGDAGNYSTATQYSYGCGVCHRGTHRDGGSGSGSDVDPWRVQVVFDNGLNRDPSRSYTPNAPATDIGPNNEYFQYSLGTCNNIYCHSNGVPVNAPVQYAAPQFNRNTRAPGNNCRVCHGNNDSAAPSVGRSGGSHKGGSPAHVKHIDGATYRYPCARCHAATVSADNVVSDKSRHINGSKDVSFDAWAGGSYSNDSSYACSNTYCHSLGTSVVAPYGAGVKVPSWDNANPNGQIDCNGCHGGTGQTGIAAGMPSYPSGTPKANSHASHVQGRGIACRMCHAKVTTTGTSIDNAALHVNKAYNVDPSTADGVSFTYSAGGGTCANISCHGGAGSTWGNVASADCRDCHGRSTAGGGDRDNFLPADGAVSYIDNEAWGGLNSGTGHGRTGSSTYNSGNRPGNNSVTPGIFNTCTNYCHTTSVPHGTANNPFRLTTKGTTPVTDFADGALNPQTQQQKDNLVCLDCHDGAGGVNRNLVFSAFVAENHFGIKHGTDQTKGGTFCVDCHDPHGDPNDYMIHDNITVKSDGLFGVPDSASGSRATIVFRGILGDNTAPSGFDWADYANSSRNGVCQVCHTGTSYFLSTTWTAADASHNKSGTPAIRCTTCHDHGRDFGASCNGCHGYPPIDNAVVPGPGNYADGRSQDYAGGGAGHNAPDHVPPTVVATDGWTPCLKCHPSGSHGQGGQTVLRTNVQVAIDNLYRAKTGTLSYAGGAAWTCSGVSCHGGVTTPRWDNGSIALDTQCTACHIRENVSNRAAATQFQSAISGLHAVTTTVSGKDHWNDAGATCGGANACHAAQPANHFGANLLDNALVEMTTANAGLRAGISVAAGASHDPNQDTCAVSCHMDGGRWARLNDKARATASIDNSAVCATCHGTFATGWTAGAGVLVRPNMTSVGGPPALTGAHDADWDGDAASAEVSPNHSTCKTCHGMNSRTDLNANYKATTMWDPAGATSDHGNGKITMNGPSAAINIANNAVPAGSEYNGNDDNTLEASDWACTKACHSGAGNANHNMGRSGWPLQYGDFGAGACSSCHGVDATGQYWPSVAPGAYPDRKGAHDNHVDAIGSWLYAETGATLLTDTGKGPSATKQIAICSWCHPDPGNPRPGTGESSHADYASPADVHGDGRAGASASYLQYFNGNLAVPGSDNDIGAAYNGATQSCSTAKCHNRVATPVSPSGWNNPPVWTTTGCATGQCHATPAWSGPHYRHYAPKQANLGIVSEGAGYACSECHVAPASLQHPNGQVNLYFGGLEATAGGGNGFYDKDNSGGGAPTAGDNNFRPYDNVYNRSCANIYCHGGDSAWGGSDPTPVWDNAVWRSLHPGNAQGSGNCGTCHGTYGSPYSDNGSVRIPVTAGNHPIHFLQYNSGGLEVQGRGPRLDPHGAPRGGCNVCHNINESCTSACHSMKADTPTGTHADGKVDFRTDILTYPGPGTDPYTGATLAATPACNNCHSTATVVTKAHPSPGTTGVAAAKANWDNGTYRLDCLTCHNGAGPAWSKSGGASHTGSTTPTLTIPPITAPDVYGDGTGYGAESRGHNRPSAAGSFPGSNNPAANLTCVTCHNAASLHITGVRDNTYSGNRLDNNVNAVTGLSTSDGLCAACHTNAAGGPVPVSKRSVNTHGNAGYPGRLESGATFTTTCRQCHEPHGMVNVSEAPAGNNLWMIRPTVVIVENTVTYGPVRLFARSGANSFNNYDPGAGQENSATSYNANARGELCAVCHADPSNPGYPTRYNVSGRHNAPKYSGNEVGKDCSGCHSHNQDGTNATADGLMPLACNGCHSYPGLDNTGANLKQMTPGHWKHVGQPLPVGNGANNRAYECTICHFSYLHNPSGVQSGVAWPASYYDNVDIRFDNTWNPGTPTYAGANAYSQSAKGVGGTGSTAVCAGLYCHGGNASLNAGWNGSGTSPRWDNTSYACGSCHDTGTSDTTPGTRMSTGNHPAHIDNAGRLYGPETSKLTGAGPACSDGTGCHTAYGLAPTSPHVNNQVSLRTSASDNTPTNLGGTQVCANCHGTTASSQGTGDTLARTQSNWDNASYKLPCVTCHNNGTQTWQNMDGTGGRAPNIDVAYYGSGNGHGAPGIDNASTSTDSGLTDQAVPVRCNTCHDESLAHIGTAKDGTNPWRFAAATNYTQTGGLDRFCLEQCHTTTPSNHPARHAWRVLGSGVAPAQGKDNAVHTHPTSQVLVPSGKDRWFQLPSGTEIPVQDNLTTKSAGTRTGNSLLVCVSCHDPHGVGTAPTATRSFSGTNTETSKQMLRYNYSGQGGGTTDLCAKCHI